jgi:hypothetical protein
MNNNDHKRARELLSRADKILKAVDDCYIIKERGHHPRPMPTFKHSEIEIGRTLGAGGFGIVNEITAFDLEHEPEVSPEQEVVEKSNIDDDANDAQEQQNQEGDDDIKQEKDTQIQPESSETMQDGKLADCTGELFEDDSHYEVTGARSLMANRCLRRGVTRYALKRLHDNLTEVEKARGMIDLAVEAKYLSVVWHPNIGKYIGNQASFFMVRVERMYLCKQAVKANHFLDLGSQ